MDPQLPTPSNPDPSSNKPVKNGRGRPAKVRKAWNASIRRKLVRLYTSSSLTLEDQRRLLGDIAGESCCERTMQNILKEELGPNYKDLRAKGKRARGNMKARTDDLRQLRDGNPDPSFLEFNMGELFEFDLDKSLDSRPHALDSWTIAHANLPTGSAVEAKDKASNGLRLQQRLDENNCTVRYTESVIRDARSLVFGLSAINTAVRFTTQKPFDWTVPNARPRDPLHCCEISSQTCIHRSVAQDLVSSTAPEDTNVYGRLPRNPHVRDVRRDTIFHIAARKGATPKYLRNLLKHYPDFNVNTVNCFGQTFLHLANPGQEAELDEADFISLIQEMAGRNADLSCRDFNGQTALMKILSEIDSSRAEAFNRLVLKPIFASSNLAATTKAFFDSSSDRFGKSVEDHLQGIYITPFSISSYFSGHAEIMNLSDWDQLDDRFGYRLSFDVTEGCTTLIAANKPHPRSYRPYVPTASQIASSILDDKGIDAALEVLNSGVLLNTYKYWGNLSIWDGFTPLHIAINSRNRPAIKAAKLVQKLIERGANPHWLDYQGRSPLWVAVERGSVEVAVILLKHGADPNFDPYGFGFIDEDVITARELARRCLTELDMMSEPLEYGRRLQMHLLLSEYASSGNLPREKPLTEAILRNIGRRQTDDV
ncbi:ankyrin [Eremomyces bilateralis CBS 781.70]|uniref:Ankyrin n=1 Tax=Eremomyces bilateralis CBS 781.70 TaxID=1392243 RepID=A0A6G1G9G9_9PEZI|nr:ankyrin [Eremomyces bilateralis CBS 781.70]KAF1814674.1 ankyrin [Eremomyces bilateralis CBS 781.70]